MLQLKIKTIKLASYLKKYSNYMLLIRKKTKL